MNDNLAIDFPQITFPNIVIPAETLARMKHTELAVSKSFQELSNRNCPDLDELNEAMVRFKEAAHPLDSSLQELSNRLRPFSDGPSSSFETLRETAAQFQMKLRAGLSLFPVISTFDDFGCRIGEAISRGHQEAKAKAKTQRSRRGRPNGTSYDSVNAVIIEFGVEFVMSGAGTANCIATELIAEFGWSGNKSDQGEKFFTRSKDDLGAIERLGKSIRRNIRERRP